jgi:hypothetical protein
MDSQPTDKVDGVGNDFVRRGGQDKTPIKQKRNSCQCIVVSAGTPTVIVTAGNEQDSAPWTDESPGGTVTTSAYNGSEKTPQKPRDSRVHTMVSADTPSNVHPCVSAAAKTLGGTDLMAEPVMGDSAPAEDDALTEDDRDETNDEVEDFVWGGSDDAPTEDDRDEADDEAEDLVWGGSEKTPKKIAIAACIPW